MLDITERKEAEEQLERALEVEREATQRLRALDEMKNTFLQAVSHDLRTPARGDPRPRVTLERGDDRARAGGDARPGAPDRRERPQARPPRHRPARPRPARARDRRRRSCSRPTSSELVRRVVAESDLVGRWAACRSTSQPVDRAGRRRRRSSGSSRTCSRTPSGTRPTDPRAGSRSCGRRRRRADPSSRTRARRAPRSCARPSSNRSVRARTRPSTHPGVGVGLTLVRAVRRAARRAGVGRGAGGRRRVVPRVPRRRSATAAEVGTAGSSAGRVSRPQARPATTGWSTALGPTCAAPPGEPTPLTSSLNHSALIGVNCFHSAGHVVLVEDRRDRDRPARTRRSPRTRPGGCRASAGPRRCSRRGTRRRRPGPSRRCTARRSCRSSASAPFPRFHGADLANPSLRPARSRRVERAIGQPRGERRAACARSTARGSAGGDTG